MNKVDPKVKHGHDSGALAIRLVHEDTVEPPIGCETDGKMAPGYTDHGKKDLLSGRCPIDVRSLTVGNGDKGTLNGPLADERGTCADENSCFAGSRAVCGGDINGLVVAHVT